MNTLHRVCRVAGFLLISAGNTLAANWHVATNGNDAASGTNWATAKQTIQAAVDAAGDHEVIFVSNGVYQTGIRATPGGELSNRLVVTKDVVVTSMNGPSVTAILGVGPRGPDAIRCVYLAAGQLSGFTLANGATLSYSGIDAINGAGGGIYAEGSYLPISNCVISGNSAVWGGGAYQGNLTDCFLAGNNAEHGGATYQSLNNSCIISNNQATGYGGGCTGGSLDRCQVMRNQATYGGGVSSCALSNSAVVFNLASYGGGVQGDSFQNFHLSHCTIAGNEALVEGGGACSMDPSYWSDISSSILYDNMAPKGANYSGTLMNFYNSCTLPVPDEGSDNFDADPLFAGDFRLSAMSPCRINGSSGSAESVDIDGEPWGEPASIGCDEYYGPELTGSMSVVVNAQAYTSVVDTAIQFWCRVSGRSASNLLSFGDGVVITNQAMMVSHAWSSTGTYPVVLSAYNQTYSQGISATVTVKILSGAATARYVWTNSPSPLAPYTNWTTASRSIQAAVDAQPVFGGWVIVTNGVYSTGALPTPDGGPSNRVVVTNHVLVKSVNGPAATIIKGAGPMGSNAVRGVYMTAGVLSGFTITNGFTHAYSIFGSLGWLSGGGVLVKGGGTLTNCIIAGNAADYYGGGTQGGVLKSCIIRGNRSSQYGGGAYDSDLYSCTIDGNSAGIGGGASESLLEDCIVSGNVGGIGGGGASSDLKNCLVVSNRADNGGGASFGRLENCVVRYNVAAIGGGVWSKASEGWCRVSDSLIEFNLATYNGGGAAGAPSVYYPNNETILQNCVVRYNRAAQNGGGVYSATANNCLIMENQAMVGGGGCDFYGGSAARLAQCTIIGNSAHYAGGVYGSRLRSSIIYFNRALAGGSYPNADPEIASVETCCMTPDYWQLWGANITNDPQLVSASHIAFDSPCVAGGSEWGMVRTDLDGEPWGTPRSSIGCDEVVASNLVGELQVAILPEGSSVVVNTSMAFTAQIEGLATCNRWSFGDGHEATNAYYSSHAWSTTGVFPVVLAVFNGSYPGGLNATTWIRVVSATASMRYAWTNSPSPAAPFTNWTTAARTLQQAIDAQDVVGGLVLATNGIYANGGMMTPGGNLSNRVAITKRVSVVSVNGPSNTTIRGGGTLGANPVRGVYMSAGSMAGFTISGGCTLTNTSMNDLECDRTGGGMLMLDGLASNCVIASCAAFSGGGIGYGHIVSSVVQSNFAQDCGGGGWQTMANHCLFANNVAKEGGGGRVMVATNCSFIGNKASNGGGVSLGCYEACRFLCNEAECGGASCDGNLIRCLVISNTARFGGGCEGGGHKNCLISGNLAISIYLPGEGDAGPSWWGGEAGGTRWGTMTNCTIVGNIASNYAGGVDGSSLKNCIVYMNSAPSNANWRGGSFEYSCTTPLPEGVGNITNTPQFVNAGDQDFSLAAGSPCIDAGFDSTSAGSVDIDSNPRVVNDIVDMGAFENQGGGSTPVGYWAWASEITNGLTNYNDCATGDGFPNLLKYATGSSSTDSDDLPRLVCAQSNGIPVLVFNRNTNAGDATLIVQGAFAITNGAIWTGLATNINGSWSGVSNVAESGAGNPVTCRVLDTGPISTSRFLRLKITHP